VHYMVIIAETQCVLQLQTSEELTQRSGRIARKLGQDITFAKALTTGKQDKYSAKLRFCKAESTIEDCERARDFLGLLRFYVCV
jgi:hypothetical protein